METSKHQTGGEARMDNRCWLNYASAFWRAVEERQGAAALQDADAFARGTGNLRLVFGVRKIPSPDALLGDGQARSANLPTTRLRSGSVRLESERGGFFCRACVAGASAA